MSISEFYRTVIVRPTPIRRIRSVLALSTLIIGSVSGYWFLIEYVLP